MTLLGAELPVVVTGKWGDASSAAECGRIDGITCPGADPENPIHHFLALCYGAPEELRQALHRRQDLIDLAFDTTVSLHCTTLLIL